MLPTVNITIQHSIFSECLDTYEHSFGSTLGGYNSTFHHNLWACNTGRNSSVGMIYDFTFALRDKRPGDRVEVSVVRGGEKLTVTVELTNRP